jgi:phage terminase Nu1 subunit (DNA packaging protein)
MTALATKTEFADLIGVHKSHISHLIAAGRIVLVGEGRTAKVDIAASRALMQQTADPAHAGKGGAHDMAPGKMSHISDFNRARARNESAKADLAEMEAAKERGSLVDAELVRLFAADLGATFRAALEVLPDRLAAELVALHDVDAIRALLVENLELLLIDLTMKIEKGVAA